MDATRWADLVTTAPGLQRFAVEAGEAARNRWAGWSTWFPQHGGFCALVRSESDYRVAVDHLVGVFRSAWRERWGGEPPRPRR
jgi:hypothetical protein